LQSQQQLFVKDPMSLMESTKDRSAAVSSANSGQMVPQMSPLQVLQSQLGLTPQQLQVLMHQQLAFQSVSTWYHKLHVLAECYATLSVFTKKILKENSPKKIFKKKIQKKCSKKMFKTFCQKIISIFTRERSSKGLLFTLLFLLLFLFLLLG
jgi:hypothetical protein